MSGEKNKDRGTFVISILSRENSTWQGKITWADKNEIQYFRSALELLKMIDGTLNERGAQE